MLIYNGKQTCLHRFLPLIKPLCCNATVPTRPLNFALYKVRKSHFRCEVKWNRHAEIITDETRFSFPTLPSSFIVACSSPFLRSLQMDFEQLPNLGPLELCGCTRTMPWRSRLVLAAATLTHKCQHLWWSGPAQVPLSLAQPWSTCAGCADRPSPWCKASSGLVRLIQDVEGGDVVTWRKGTPPLIKLSGFLNRFIMM